jgi:hypothetical protein
MHLKRRRHPTRSQNPHEPPAMLLTVWNGGAIPIRTEASSDVQLNSGEPIETESEKTKQKEDE